MTIKLQTTQGWREGSVVKNTDYPLEGSRFNSQHTHRSSQSSRLSLRQFQEICHPHTNTHKIKLNKLFLKIIDYGRTWRVGWLSLKACIFLYRTGVQFQTTTLGNSQLLVTSAPGNSTSFEHCTHMYIPQHMYTLNKQTTCAELHEHVLKFIPRPSTKLNL